MIDFSLTRLEDLAIHKVGNKSREEQLRISKEKVQVIDDETRDYLMGYLLSSFKSNELYQFTHPSDLQLNEIYTFADAVFKEQAGFYIKSVEIAKHLYEQSVHPKVNTGELCVCYFKDCNVNGDKVDALGIFKSETKDVFLNFSPVKDNFNVKHQTGININKLDKGCLIFNISREEGYQVAIVDANKSGDTQYWKEHFLNIKPCADSYHFTKDFLSITKNYVTKQLSEEFETTKADQIDILNRSMEYFQTRESFDKKEFEQEVFQDNGLIESFRKFDESFREEHDIELEDRFEISSQALKKQAKVFKSVLKLDKNFHIYIHGNKDLIEKGFDPGTGKHFYKIYFNEES